jgi:TPR repeat protein
MVSRSGRNVTDLAARLAPRGNTVERLRAEASSATEEYTMSDLERRAMRDAPPELRRRLMPRMAEMDTEQQPAPQRTAPQTQAQKPVPPKAAAPQPTPQRPASPAPQIASDRLLKILMDVSDRLKRSESERELLWRELENTRRVMEDLADKTNRSDKTQQQLHAAMQRRDCLAEELLKKQQEIQTSHSILSGQVEDALTRAQGLEERLQLGETTTSSLLVKINDLLGDSVKLSRRLDQMTQDKTRLLRKIETVEDTLLQTQDTLRAKALVLLTDQSVAARTGLPQDTAPALHGPAARGAAAAAMPRGSLFERPEALPVWMQALAKRPLMSTTALIVCGLLLGWGLNGAPLPHIEKAASTAETKLEDAAASQARPVAATAVTMSDAAVLSEMQAEESAAASAVTSAPTVDIASLISRDPELPEIVKSIEDQAFGGSAEAQHDLAAIYTAGHAGVKQNYGRAIDWFTLAAQNGVANARYNLGVLYHQGLGVSVDKSKAVSYYRAAAFLSHPEALYNLGIAALAGEGMETSPQRAELYFTRAANLGLVEGAYNLGRIYGEGMTGEQSDDEALFWYKLAANNGNDEAKSALDALTSRMGIKSAAINERFTAQAALHPEAMRALGDSTAASGDAKPEKTTSAPPAKKSSTLKTPAAPAIDTARPGLREPTAAEAKAEQTTAIISQIQEQLARAGFYKGDATGTMNSDTGKAIEKYQRKNGIKVDGKPTEDLLVNMLAREFSIDVAPN